MGEVSLAWAAIDRWLEKFAPASAEVRHKPATTAEIAATEAVLGFDFPPDFIESLTLHDGQPPDSTDFPYSVLLPLADIVELRQNLMEVASKPDQRGGAWTGLGQDEEDHRRWHARWLPITELDGATEVEVLDCRPGPGFGRLGTCLEGEGGHFGLGWGWPSFAAHLDEIATALTEGSDFYGMAPHLTAEGKLRWAEPGGADGLIPVQR